MTDQQNGAIINLNPGPYLSQKAGQSAKTLYDTNATKKDIKKRTMEEIQAEKLQNIAEQAREKYMAAVENYKQRTNVMDNQYSNKSVILADGTKGFVNNLGYFQKYVNEKNTVGMNKCPPKNESVDAPYAANEASLLSLDSIIGLADNKNQYTSCGSEGKNVFVSSILSDEPPAVPLKCIELKPNSMTVVKYPGDSDPNQFTFDSCKRYAIANGFSYFGLQNFKTGDNTNMCLVGNNYAKIIEGGDAKSIVSNVELWNSSVITAPNAIRFRPLPVGRHPALPDRGNQNAKILKNAIDDTSMVVGNKRLNTGRTGEKDDFEIIQQGKDVIVKILNAQGWTQDLVLPVYLPDDGNMNRITRKMASNAGLKEMQSAYRDWKRRKLSGDIVMENTDDIANKPPKINSIKIHQTGQIWAYPKTKQQGKVILRIPSTVARDACNDEVGPITFIGATYGSNAPKNTATDNNALANLIGEHDKAENPDTFSFKVTNRLVSKDPARGYRKDLIVNYKCGDVIMPNKTIKEGNFGTIDCNITRSEASGKPCSAELRILGGDNARALAGLELVIISGDGRENTVWRWYMSKSQTEELILDSSPADNNYLRQAKYVGKMDSSQVELNTGEYAVSDNGKVELRINENGHLSVAVRTNRSACIIGPDGNRTTTNKETAFVYSVPYEATDPKALGKMGYVDRNGVLHPYTKQVFKPGKGYTRLNQTTIKGNDLPQQPIEGPTMESCMEHCDKTTDCYGAVFEKTSQMCYLKDAGALTAEKWASKNDIFMERKVALDKKAINEDCRKYPLAYIDSRIWNGYPKGNPMTQKTKCDLQIFLQEPAIVELREDWLRKQKKANEFTGDMTNIAENTMDGRYLQIEEQGMNVSSGRLNKIVYDNNMINKIPRASYQNADPLPPNKPIKYANKTQLKGDKNIEGFTIATGEPEYSEIYENPQPALYGPGQRDLTTRYRHIQGILSDSESLVNEENFNYALWGVAAIVGAVIAFRIIKKTSEI